jgi:hypothetical protein
MPSEELALQARYPVVLLCTGLLFCTLAGAAETQTEERADTFCEAQQCSVSATVEEELLAARPAEASQHAASAGAASAGAPSTSAGGQDSSDLAKASQNPVADLISLPLQYNTNFGVGPYDHTQHVLNIQPVIPIHLNEDWNLITRAIMPIIHQPRMGPGLGPETGLGDLQLTGFLSPAKPGKLIWGVGPVLRFPTATDDLLGSEKWSAGPSAVLLRTHGPWVFGGLVQNVWSFGGDSDRADVNEFLLQPFVNYNLPKGWYLSTAPNITANWKADGDSVWTVPLGGGVGKVFKIGKQPVNVSLRTYYNAVRPDNGPEWTAQLQLTLLFPF